MRAQLSRAFRFLKPSKTIENDPEDEDEVAKFSKGMSKLAIETRLAIFEHVLYSNPIPFKDHMEGKTPSLVKALRPHPIFYQEALMVWYDKTMMKAEPIGNTWLKTEVFGKKWRTAFKKHWSPQELNPEVLKLVRILMVEHKSPSTGPFPKLAIQTPPIALATNIREFHLKYQNKHEILWYDQTHCELKHDKYAAILDSWLPQLKNLKRLVITVTCGNVNRRVIMETTNELNVVSGEQTKNLVNDINTRFRNAIFSLGRLELRGCDDFHAPIHEMLMWEARKGECLVWYKEEDVVDGGL